MAGIAMLTLALIAAVVILFVLRAEDHDADFEPEESSTTDDVQHTQ